jgi:hypothetical protein
MNRLITTLSNKLTSSQNGTLHLERNQISGDSLLWMLKPTFRENMRSPEGDGIKFRMTATVPWRLSGRNAITLTMMETLMSTYNPTNLMELGPMTAVSNSAYGHAQSIFQGTAH